MATDRRGGGNCASGVSKLNCANTLSRRTSSDLGLVPIDGLLIQQVLINLLENAVKYSPPGTPLDISASRDDDRVLVEVADRGPGVVAGDECGFSTSFIARYSPAADPEWGWDCPFAGGLSSCTAA